MIELIARKREEMDYTLEEKEAFMREALKEAELALEHDEIPIGCVIVKTSIGPNAALVPLSFAVFAFFARQVQVVLAELDGGVIEAAQASGATFWDIVGVYLSEGLPDFSSFFNGYLF